MGLSLASFRKAAARLFGTEPARSVFCLTREAIGRIVEADSVQALQDAAHFVHQKDLVQKAEHGQLHLIQETYAMRAKAVHGEELKAAAAKAGNPSPSTSMQDWFSNLATNAPEAVAFDAVPALKRPDIAYRKDQSLKFEILGRLYLAERTVSRNVHTTDHIDAAGQFIVKNDLKSCLAASDLIKVVTKYDEIAAAVTDVMNKKGVQAGTPRPKTLAQIENEVAHGRVNYDPGLKRIYVRNVRA